MELNEVFIRNSDFSTINDSEKYMTCKEYDIIKTEVHLCKTLSNLDTKQNLIKLNLLIEKIFNEFDTGERGIFEEIILNSQLLNILISNISDSLYILDIFVRKSNRIRNVLFNQYNLLNILSESVYQRENTLDSVINILALISSCSLFVPDYLHLHIKVYLDILYSSNDSPDFLQKRLKISSLLAELSKYNNSLSALQNIDLHLIDGDDCQIIEINRNIFCILSNLSEVGFVENIPIFSVYKYVNTNKDALKILLNISEIEKYSHYIIIEHSYIEALFEHHDERIFYEIFINLSRSKKSALIILENVNMFIDLYNSGECKMMVKENILTIVVYSVNTVDLTEKEEKSFIFLFLENVLLLDNIYLHKLLFSRFLRAEYFSDNTINEARERLDCGDQELTHIINQYLLLALSSPTK